jgi:hypothetical protein
MTDDIDLLRLATHIEGVGSCPFGPGGEGGI